MTQTDPDEQAGRLAAESLAALDATGWFDRLYLAAEEGKATVPWDRGAPQRMLVEWAEARGVEGAGRRALVVGCGFGEDAEYFARLGFETVAFDVSGAAVRGALRRFPESKVEYLTADLLNPPARWRAAFDLVVESLTVQSLPEPQRRQAIGLVARLVRPGGTLIVVAAARDEAEGPVQGPPWPLTRAEIDAFASSGLRPVAVEDLDRPDLPFRRRWRAEFRHPEPGR
jgi:SAM-dependent methyltransferase